MTLEEAIKYCEEVAEKQRSRAHMHKDMMVFNQTIKHNSEAEYYEELMNECNNCAEEYRQFAEWLKELKAYREFAGWLVNTVLEDDWEESADFYAEVLCRKLTKLGKLKVVDNKYMEVNVNDT